MDELEERKRAGTFTISPGKDVYGELTLAGQKTSLYLHDKELNTDTISGQCVMGVLHDLTKVSLIQCITPSVPGSVTRGNERYNFANIFPHYVVLGDDHIAPAEQTIAEVHFVVDDASTLFYDFDAFGSLIDARPFIEQIANANAFGRKITTGADPAILYFTGKREIFATDTVLGRISASHNPSHNMGGPDGMSLKNTIFITIAFKEAVNFKDAIFHTSTLLPYLGILVGRPQNLLQLSLRIESDNERPVLLKVYWSMPPKWEPSHGEQRPHPTDVLLDAVRQPDAFSHVLGRWLDRQQEWRDARLRFFHSFAKQQHYDIDRLIGSANMFDILPESAVPPAVQLSEELKAAKKECCKIFEKLEVGPERTSVLNALGRVGKSNLKRKIRHRAEPLMEAVGKGFPELDMVTDKAVDRRNYYVHGSGSKRPRFNYSDNLDIFFTDTLEFVFAASDLIEAGWDVKAWSEMRTTMSHPFAQYRISYDLHLRELKALLG